MTGFAKIIDKGKKIQHHLSLQHSPLAKFWPGWNLLLCPFMFPGNHISLVCWFSQMIVSDPPFCPRTCNNFSPILILSRWPSFYLTKGKKTNSKQFLETSPPQLITHLWHLYPYVLSSSPYCRWVLHLKNGLLTPNTSSSITLFLCSS